tara:strand:+ start:798 stop:1157 length:360 start_codon:yes stop_codon:yes gene_type:complete
MSPFIPHLINAGVLIVFPAWGYLSSETPSLTALIPTAFGLLLVACAPGVKSENKVVAHIAVVLTLIVLLALFMPLRGAIGREDGLAVFRVGVMMLTSAVAMVFFVKSFIDARKAREAGD